MATPLYKKLKSNSTTIYAFPGAEEDINQQSENYKMNFSKFALINLPAYNATGTASPVYWDFESNFYSASDNSANSYGDQVINSLRNYVANQEVTIRGTKVDQNNFFYDNSLLKTNSERIFWKWCKKLNLLDFEIAADGDEYFGNLDEFQSNNTNDVEYFREFLWKERKVSNNSFTKYRESNETGYTGKLEVEYTGSINYKEGDFVQFFDVTLDINGIVADFPLKDLSKYLKVLKVIKPTSGSNYIVIYDIAYNNSPQVEPKAYSKLIYNKLINYIGEIQGSNNVVSQNLSYDQIIASIPDNAGQTPNILFRTTFDNNYKPSLRYPILPSQYQPEIKGAENFNSPIVNNPSKYPGDQYAQYDNDNNLNEYNYLTSNGDFNRRSGDYFGVKGDTNNTSFDNTSIDGINVDFDIDHYVKMNVINQEVGNFDEFNIEQINGKFPKDFEFNAILWYYDVEDVNGNIATNLYGISFVDNPINDLTNAGNKFPAIKKMVATNDQDGTAFQFSLNRHTTLTTEQPQPQFSNEYINNLFGNNLYNEVMRRLVVFNDAALKIVTDNKEVIEEVNALKQLIYTQSDITTINNRIQTLTELMKLYNTNQLVSSPSIEVVKDNSVSPPEIKLNSIEGGYNSISIIETKNLYKTDGIIPQAIAVPRGKDFMVKIENNDDVVLELPDNQKLNIFLNRDLDYKQTVDFMIDGTETSTVNKQLDIYITYIQTDSVPILVKTFTNIDLPVYYNNVEQAPNKAKQWNQINENIDSFKLNNDGETISINVNRVNGLIKGDSILLQNIFFGLSDPINIDGQYIIDSVDTTNNIINIDYTQNLNLNSYIDQEIENSTLSNGSVITDYNSLGSYKFNKGYKLSVTRISELDSSSFEDRYLLSVSPLD